MATARFTSGAEAEEQQFTDAAGEDTEDSQTWPDVENPKAAKQEEGETIKSKGKTGDQPMQAEQGAEAPPEENPPAPMPSDPKPGTSKESTDTSTVDPTHAPTQDPTQDPTEDPEEETPPDLTEYIKSYQQAGKAWLDTVLVNREQAYNTLFAKLLQLGDPHIDKF